MDCLGRPFALSRHCVVDSTQQVQHVSIQALRDGAMDLEAFVSSGLSATASVSLRVESRNASTGVVISGSAAVNSSVPFRQAVQCLCVSLCCALLCII